MQRTRPETVSGARGKLILYHGWSDAAIPALNAANYYQSVVSKMGAKNADRFVRLFMVPGMQHCAGGSGPNSFGQLAAGGGRPSARHRRGAGTLVEQGIARNRSSPQSTRRETSRQRCGADAPALSYPQVARWKGSGSTMTPPISPA